MRRVQIRNAVQWLTLIFAIAFPGLHGRVANAQEIRVARSVEEIHKIPYDELFNGVRVDLECVVSCYEPDWAILFIHDGHFGMYAGGLHNLPVKTGDHIRIQGLLGTNRVPVNCTYEPSNNHIQLPEPKQFTFENLQNGSDDSQYGQIEGQLVGIGSDHHQTSLEMRTSEGGRFRGLIHGTKLNSSELRRMLGRRIRLRGTVGSRFDEFDRWTGFQIWLGVPSNIEVIDNPDQPQTIPILPIAELNADRILATKSSYFRTEGVVACQISPNMILIRDRTHELFVEIQGERPVQLDQFYEVSGSLDTSISPAILRMSELTLAPEKFAVEREAVRLPMNELMNGEFSGQLVRASGVYSGPFEIEGEKGFFLRADNHMLPVFVTDGLQPDAASGTNVDVEGIWVQQKSLVGFNIGSCALYARTSGIHLGTQVPWVLLSVLGVVALVAAISSAWAVTLRRQVHRKTQEVLDSIALQRKTEEQYAHIFINARVLVMTTDAAGHITAVNPATLKQTQKREAELLGMHVTELVEPDSIPFLKDLLSRAVGSDRRFSCEVRLGTSQGQSVPLEVNCWSTQIEQSTTLHLIWHDISERLRIAQERFEFDQQMVSMQKMESLGVLAGGIAHDFNNLLTVILGNASLLHGSPKLDSDERSSLESIQNAASRAADLTQQMLAYAGRGKFDVRVLNLSHLVREMSQLLSASIARTSHLIFDLDDNLPTIHADATQLRQILLNLSLNASEALEGKPGVIRITTQVAELHARSEVGYRCVGFAAPASDPASDSIRQHDYVLLEVSDDGCGMTESVLARILDPFYTTKFSGRGLGLSTVVGIVRSHHGSLSIQSEIGRGSTFRVYLPIDRFPQPSLSKEGSGPSIEERLNHVLIVDDEPSILMLMKRTLEQSGIQVASCATAHAALEKLQNLQTPIDCLVTDVTMPEMDGLELSRIAQQLRPNLPIVLCSGFSVNVHPHELNMKGPCTFLKKPFQTRELSSLVSRMISDTRMKTAGTSQKVTPISFDS